MRTRREASLAANDKPWFVYLLQSSEHGTYYIGATVDVQRRLYQHNQGKGGMHTRTRRPWRLLYVIPCQGRSSALKLEARMKKIQPSKKEQAFKDSGAT